MLRRMTRVLCQYQGSVQQGVAQILNLLGNRTSMLLCFTQASCPATMTSTCWTPAWSCCRPQTMSSTPACTGCWTTGPSCRGSGCAVRLCHAVPPVLMRPCLSINDHKGLPANYVHGMSCLSWIAWSWPGVTKQQGLVPHCAWVFLSAFGSFANVLVSVHCGWRYDSCSAVCAGEGREHAR